MKIYRKIALLLALLLFSPCSNIASASTLSYALIGEGAILLGEDFKPITSLPENYFVTLIGDDEPYQKVSYLDIDGFISQKNLTKVDYEPKYKHHESATLTLSNDGHSVNIRSSPTSKEDNILAVFPSGQTLYYYGSVEGEPQFPLAGNEWYFVRFFDADGQKRHGYIYSLYAFAEPIQPNLIEPVKNEQPQGSIEKEKAQTLILPVSKEVIIIIALCIPVVIITYLLFRERKETED